jgi:hypothetical protein
MPKTRKKAKGRAKKEPAPAKKSKKVKFHGTWGVSAYNFQGRDNGASDIRCCLYFLIVVAMLAM